MNKNILLYILLLFTITFNTFSQKNFTIYSENGKKPIANVNIVSLMRDIGVVTDEIGNAVLKINIKDSILISAIGYNSLKIKIENLNNDTIFLIKKIIKSNDVIVVGKVYNKTKKFGFLNNKGKDRFLFIGNGMLATYIINPTGQVGLIKSLEFKLKFAKKGNESNIRIRLFGVDANNNPAEEITDENIILAYSELKKHTKINLEKYNYFIEEKGLFVSIEIINNIKSEKSKVELDCANTFPESYIWSNYMNKEWRKINNQMEGDTHISTPKISITIKY